MARRLMALWIFWLVLSLQPWGNLNVTTRANPVWIRWVLIWCYILPMVIMLPLFNYLETDVDLLVSWWFIALAVMRGISKYLLGQVSVVLVSHDSNVLLGVTLIVTACIPLWDGAHVPMDPETRGTLSHILWHCFLWSMSHVLAFGYLLFKILYRVLRFKLLVNRMKEMRGAEVPESSATSVLIVHASVGAGHKRAAQALQEAFEMADPTCEVLVADIMSMGGIWFERIYKSSYLKLVDFWWGSYLVGYLFDLGNQAPPGCLKRAGEAIFLLDFVDFLYCHRFDLIVHTHFLSQEFVALLRRRGWYHTPHVAVVTDFDAHAWWTVQPLEQWFVARTETKLQLAFHGVPCDKVEVTGIPIVPAFLKCPPREQCLKELNLQGEAPIVVLLSFGPPVLEAFRYLLEVKLPLEIVVVCGRQNDIRRELEAIPVPAIHKVKLEGFTLVMERYMRCADIVVTKPGGLTTSECLASSTAIVIVNPYPGQEMRNSDMLLEAGCARKCTDLFLLGFRVEEMVRDRSRLEAMKKSAGKLATPNAAFDIVSRCRHLMYADDDLSEVSVVGSDSDDSVTDELAPNSDELLKKSRRLRSHSMKVEACAKSEDVRTFALARSLAEMPSARDDIG